MREVLFPLALLFYVAIAAPPNALEGQQVEREVCYNTKLFNLQCKSSWTTLRVGPKVLSAEYSAEKFRLIFGIIGFGW